MLQFLRNTMTVKQVVEDIRRPFDFIVVGGTLL